jgi:Cu2+-exporting ATPase
MNDHTVDIVFHPQQTRLSEIADRLGQLGYRLAPLTGGDGYERAAAENRRLLVQIAIAGFCAMNAMWLAVALYAGTFSGIATDHEAILRNAGVVLGVISVAIPGRTFFRGALASLRTRTPHMDLPIALGIGVGAAGGVYSAITGEGEVYFDSVAVLVFFLLVGRWVQFRQQRRAAEAVGLLMRLAPRTASLLDEQGVVRTVATDSLRPGDRIRVIAGEGVAADGIVEVGESLLDRALLTGESRPIAVGPGDEVHAGTANLQTPLDVRVTAVGMESRVGRLMRLVEDAAESKAPVVQLADRIGGWFVVIVIVLAGITIGLWWNDDLRRGIHNAVALLIVACPCALAMATPLALAVGIGRAAKRKILVRGGDVLERLTKGGAIWFDKTGTLTEGKLKVTEIVSAEPERALGMAAALERSSRHPIALGIIAAASERVCEAWQADGVQQVSGGGVRGWVSDGAERHEVHVGHWGFLKDQGVAFEADLESSVEAIAGRGGTPVVVAIDRRGNAVLGIADAIRIDAVEVIQFLQGTGWQVGILSGDHPAAVSVVAEQLGISSDRAKGGMTPEDKLAAIRGSKVENATVVMVGDGVNDAAALAAADVGVALRGGAEASLEAAPVYLADGRLLGLKKLVVGARKTVGVIRRNFATSLTYNAVAVGLAMFGKIDPLLAAILMPISSLTVLSLTLGTPTFAETED